MIRLKTLKAKGCRGILDGPDLEFGRDGVVLVGDNGTGKSSYIDALEKVLTGKCGSLDTGACEAAWYGEVFDPTPSTWTTTDMGSGQFADLGIGNAAWIRSLGIFTDGSGFWTSPTVDDPMTIYDPNCYTRTPLAKQPDGELWLFLGGPGGDAPGGACR